ncbi:nicotinamide N-methyltransferase-like [Ornithodoros turicata]|uniref:nicotinamide N-methyltransferase-like n=1 Tax=Ornithodoros turicata TaxID=34597 RepID=UPI003139D479
MAFVGEGSPAAFESDVYVYQLLNDHYKWVRLTLDFLHKTFSNGSVQGHELLELGCGPTVHCVLSASRVFSNITMADLSSSNLEAVRHWLTPEDGVDLGMWKPVLQHVARLEGYRNVALGAQDIGKRARRSIRHLVQCDVLRETILPAPYHSYDCVLTSLCLEAAVSDLVSYKRALRNVVRYVRPGGTIIVIGVLGCRSYVVGEQTLSSLSLTPKDVRDAIAKAGVTQCVWNMVEKWNSTEDVNGNDWTGAFMVKGVCG